VDTIEQKKPSAAINRITTIQYTNKGHRLIDGISGQGLEGFIIISIFKKKVWGPPDRTWCCLRLLILLRLCIVDQPLALLGLGGPREMHGMNGEKTITVSRADHKSRTAERFELLTCWIYPPNLPRRCTTLRMRTVGQRPRLPLTVHRGARRQTDGGTPHQASGRRDQG
jgi:hypothetical protein